MDSGFPRPKEERPGVQTEGQVEETRHGAH